MLTTFNFVCIWEHQSVFNLIEYIQVLALLIRKKINICYFKLFVSLAGEAGAGSFGFPKVQGQKTGVYWVV